MVMQATFPGHQPRHAVNPAFADCHTQLACACAQMPLLELALHLANTAFVPSLIPHSVIAEIQLPTIAPCQHVRASSHNSCMNM